MISLRALGTASVLALIVGACATRVQVPEIPILDGPLFKAAKQEPEPKPPVEVVEVPKPLPLPGQLKPVPKKRKKAKDDKLPKDRIADDCTHVIVHDGARPVVPYFDIEGVMEAAEKHPAVLLAAPVRSMLVETDEGALPFQDYFVRRRQEPEVHRIRYDGSARPTSEVA